MHKLCKKKWRSRIYAEKPHIKLAGKLFVFIFKLNSSKSIKVVEHKRLARSVFMNFFGDTKKDQIGFRDDKNVVCLKDCRQNAIEFLVVH